MQCGDDGQRFLTLEVEDEAMLVVFVDQGDAVHEDAAGGEVSSNAFYADRDHKGSPLLFAFYMALLSFMVACSLALFKTGAILYSTW